MKKWIPMLLTFLLLFSSCGQTIPAAEVQPAHAVYFLTETTGGRELGYEIVPLEMSGSIEQQIRDVIEAMQNPLNANDRSVIGEEVELQAVDVFGSTVVIRFSEGYDCLSEIERSLLNSAVVLSMEGISDISYIRVTGDRSSSASFMNENSVLLEDGDLRLSTFEIEVYPVDPSTGRLMSYHLNISSEQEVLTPRLVLEEMLSGQLGDAAPFDGRMDIRKVSLSEDGSLRADLYIPVEMDLHGREADLWSVVNSLCSCRGVENVTVVINGRAPSERGLTACDGALTYDPTYIG